MITKQVVSLTYGSFLAPEIKYCLTNNDFGVIEQHMTLKVLLIVKNFQIDPDILMCLKVKRYRLC